MQNEAKLEWDETGTPIASRFNDPYYTKGQGLAEARHVFLAGNHLPDRFQDGFHIAELGFGTGLNFLAALQLWTQTQPNGRFRFTSFERYPMRPADMARALRPFSEVQVEAEALQSVYHPAGGRWTIGPVTLDVIIGDVAQTLPPWDDQADAWFLDGFSPARNPQMWTESILNQVAHHTRSGGSFATFTAAGKVRRGLDAAGFEVQKIPGFGTKRDMTRGLLRSFRKIP